MTEAAFQAAYAEWKVIKTRATVQLVFEIPIEQADAAYQALGGMPIAAKEVWCAIARMSSPAVSQAEKQPGSETAPAKPIRADKERRAFGDIAPAQQAGIICGERAFRLFLAEKFPQVWTITNRDPAACVREICNVDSRADIKSDNADWSGLLLAYRLWQNHPEFA